MNPGAESGAVRQAGREALSLLLLQARNDLLARLAAAPTPTALRAAARAGWFQEWWIARHVQRGRGESAAEAAPRLAGIEPRVDTWLDGSAEVVPETLHAWLTASLEVTLGLLERAAADDAGLYVFRLALQHEDRISEELGLALPAFAPAPRPQREPIGLPAQRFLLGSPAGGFVPWGERWAHEVAVPEFEIDAQCVNWAQFAEFAEDGGYDRRECWSEAGWAWLQRDGRRAPRGVEQLVGGSVLVQRGATLLRAPLQQVASPVTRHEAEAWCRWAGRRLPTEPEWELAVQAAARRGFAWGDALEWVAGRARSWPDAGALPAGTLDRFDARASEPLGVLRGAAAATPARWRHARARRFAAPEDDTMGTAFRSCAL